jgi:hypothetical protein
MYLKNTSFAKKNSKFYKICGESHQLRTWQDIQNVQQVQNNNFASSGQFFI